jgi:hypothetical protein
MLLKNLFENQRKKTVPKPVNMKQQSITVSGKGKRKGKVVSVLQLSTTP